MNKLKLSTNAYWSDVLVRVKSQVSYQGYRELTSEQITDECCNSRLTIVAR